MRLFALYYPKFAPASKMVAANLRLRVLTGENMSEHFPSLPESVLAAADQLGAWLAQDDLPVDPQIEVVVLAGNAVIPTIDFACRLAAQHAISAADQRRYRSLHFVFIPVGVKRPALPPSR